MAGGINYIGVDSNTDLKPAYDRMIELYSEISPSRIRMIYRNVKGVRISQLKFDFVLSSPPFWQSNGALSETYAHMPETALNSFLKLLAFYMPERRTRRTCIHDYIAIWGNKKYQRYQIYCYDAVVPIKNYIDKKEK